MSEEEKQMFRLEFDTYDKVCLAAGDPTPTSHMDSRTKRRIGGRIARVWF